MSRLAFLVLLSAACSRSWDDKGDDPSPDENDVDTDTDADTDTDTDTDEPADDADGDGYTEDDGDCDDDDPDVYPGADEICDGKDDDCDGDLLDGEDRDSDGDGALDCEDYCPIQVDLTAAAGGDGSFAHPFQVIQDGIDAVPATGCTEVEVHPGTYDENVDFGGVDAHVYSAGGPGLTVIDGGGDGSVVTFQTGESSAAALEGFTVTGGAAQRGAGIHVENASPGIVDNEIRGNATLDGGLGGGVYLYRSDSEIAGNTVEGNSACLGGPDDGCDGGGIAILYGAPYVHGNWILDNEAGDGGGIWVAHGEAIIANNVLDGNQADDQGFEDDEGNWLYGQGGGIDFQADTAQVWFGANVCTNNRASSHGGGVGIIGYYVETDVAEPVVENNVVAFNTVDAGGHGAGVVVWGLSGPTLTNNAVYANDGDGLYGQYEEAVIRYNDVVDNVDDWAGALGDLAGTDGNLSTSPGFFSVSDDGDWTNDTFFLSSGSALVDAGDPAISDPDGTRSDIGAYGGPYGSWP